MILQPLSREAILAPGFWRFSRPVPFLVRPVHEREAREPGLPAAELPVLWAALDAIPNPDRHEPGELGAWRALGHGRQ